MTFRRLSLATLLLATCVWAAGLQNYKDWNKSPEYAYLATDAEQKQWKKITSDEDADHFIQLFWAKRDPDLATPVNEFKVVFDKRVKEADQLFAMPRLRGALTERGKFYVLVGPPKQGKLGRQSGTRIPQAIRGLDSTSAPTPVPNPPGTTIGDSLVSFAYEVGDLPEWASVKTLTAVFVVEQSGDYPTNETKNAITAIENKARAAAIKNADLKAPPHYRTAAELEAEMKEAETAAAEALKGPTLTEPVRQALEEALTKDDTGALTLFPITVRDGEVRLQVQIFVPSPAGAPGADSRLAILVKGKTGGDGARLEEVTGFDPARGGYIASRYFAVAPGEYGVAADVFDASGKVLSTAKRSITIVPVGKEFALSPLIVASSFYPVPKSTAEQAFTLNGNHFVTKGERLDPEDGLSFVVRVYNPAVDPLSKTAQLSRTVKIKAKGSPAMDVPQQADQPIPIADTKDPGAIVAVDVAAALIEANLGEYLRKPGEYDLKVSITDMVGKKTAETTTTFTVTGTLPPKKK
jgi:GWxTD domain-containing protein